MIFRRKPTLKNIRQYKRIRIDGMRFVIQKINPLVDFSSEVMPQLFTAVNTNRKVDPSAKAPEAKIRKDYKDMGNIISAGLVKPEIGKDAKIEDIMGNQRLTAILFNEIMAHSLNAFRGIKGLFFSIKIKRILYIAYAKALDSHLIQLSSQTEN